MSAELDRLRLENEQLRTDRDTLLSLVEYLAEKADNIHDSIGLTRAQLIIPQPS